MAEPPPSFDTLTVTIEGRIGHLVLSQPDQLNPLGSLALQELAAAAHWFDSTSASVVLVAGAGRAFSAGFDLRELRSPSERSRSTPQLGAEMAEAIAGMRAVTIAAIQGPCVGGAFVLAMCCDIRVAADDAWFSLPEAELGIPLAWSGVPRLVREIGPSRTTELILSCRRVPAAELSGWGVLHDVVAPEDLAHAARSLADLIVQRRHEVIVTTKRQVAEAADALVPTAGDWAGTQHLLSGLRSLERPPDD